MAAKTSHGDHRAGGRGASAPARGQRKKLRDWAAAHRSGQPVIGCPQCIAASRHAPLGQRKIYKLPCPVHGALTLNAANQRAWQWWTRCQLVEVSVIAGQAHYRLDLPAIYALLRIYRVPPDEWADELERLQSIFNVFTQT